MNFCKKCDNMYYMKKKEGELIYYCKNCDYEDLTIIQKNNLKVFEFNKKKMEKFNYINEYTKYDVTLPHTSNIKCPNMECKSNKEDKLTQDIITIRVDDTNMKYLYLCSHCNYNWTP